ncbi:MAG TPA: hypothetical protein VL200_12080 [Lacunisphaera sp.]|jgi:hypothetical protein|nr:hypothetical protein [Lacunisphaera sp.]
MTVEEFDAWAAAQRNVADVKEACAEEGGPRVSLVPTPTSVPVDFLPDEVSIAVPAPTGLHAVSFSPEPSRKTGGWSAVRQRIFIESLAETGSVHLSAKSAGLSARGAYGLRVRSAPFAAAWDAAQQLAVGRLSALAFDRAIHGCIEQVYRDGDLIGEKQVPSERLLMWLLARLDPRRFAAPWERRKEDDSDPQAEAQQAFPTMLDALEDVAAE